MLNGLKIAIVSLFLSSPVMAQNKPVVDIYTSLPVVGSGGQIVVGITKVLNSVQNEREYRLGVVQGAQGDTSMLRALTEARNGRNVVLYNGVSTFTFNRITNKDSEFDRDKDFVISTSIGKNTYAIMVASDSDVKTIDQLVAKIKGSSKETFMATTLTAPGSIVLNDIFVKKYGIADKVKTINYKTSPEIKLAIENKEADYTVFTVPDMQNLNALVVSSPQRLSYFPNAPTANELGMKEFSLQSILVFALPKPNEKFKKIFEEDMKKVCASPDFEPISKLRAPYLSFCLTPEDSVATIQNEISLINTFYK